ncbi:TonB-dependent receptor domain-containing protein [Malaciobacter canalis]|uniref:TonB-dependent receptor domain-containing protein n=1 Tax=Malaciobacter canalis TaxID=1912871 RepID=UPI003850A13A
MEFRRKKVFLLVIALANTVYANSLGSKINIKELTSITIVEQQEQSLDLQKLKKTNPRNLTDLLRHESALDIAGGSPNAKRFYIRGISEALTNITIDGAKLSKDLHQHRGGLGNIDTELLKTVSINPGVATADSGAGNLGGSIKLETVDAQDLLKDGKNYGAFIKSGFNNIDNSYKNSLALYGKYKNLGILLYGTKGDGDDYKTGNGRTVYGSSEEVDNYLVKLSLLNLDDHDLKISTEKNTQEGLYQSGGPGSDMGYHDPDGNRELERQEVERETTILNHKYNPSDSYINTNLKLYKNDTTLSYLERDSSSDIESEGKGVDFRNTFEFVTKNFVNSLTAGVDYEKEEGTSQSGSVTYENKGLFLQNRIAFEKFNLSFGARYDDFENDLIYKNTSDEDVSFNINADYSLTENLTFFAGYGEAVSGSNTIPVGWLSNLSQNLTFNGSNTSSLDSQKSKKIEFGTAWQRSNIFSKDDNLGLKLTLFKTDIKNPIVVGTGGNMGAPVSDIVNDDDIESKGFELSTNYTIENLNMSLSYSHTDVEQNGETLIGTTKRLAGSYGDRVVADFNYKPSNNLTFGYTLTGVLENDDTTDNANNKAGYAVHDISASYTPIEFKNLTFSIAINNLFDKEYSAHTSLTSNSEAVGEPGRDIRVNLKYTF